jgi:enoyl-[acyl-carrier-protein] reductase (NADH)
MFLLGPGGRGVTAEVLMVDAGYHATACSTCHVPGALLKVVR